MPMAMLRLKPGVDVETTPSLSEAAINASNLIRFRSGLAEKLGGWDKFFAFVVGGVPKALHAWLDLNDTEYLAVGTTTLLGEISGGVLTTLTPQIFTSSSTANFTTAITSANVTVVDSNIANVTTFDSVEFKTPVSVGGLILSGVYPIDLVLGTTSYRIVAASVATATITNGGAVPQFTTVSGSANVTVTLAAHGLALGDTINFPISTTVGGITILGTYEATTITSANAFVISTATLATSSTSAFMNGGLAEIAYYIALGPIAGATGYGIGTYGSGGYGTGSSGSAQTGTPITTTNWTLDNWGEILLACPNDGGVYQWRPNSGFLNAQFVAQSPPINTGIFVSMQTQMLICYGSTEYHEIGIDQDPLLVRWSDVGDYASFAEGPSSQAGSRRLSTGSRIVGGLSAPQQELLWTDLGLWAMSYLGSLEAGVWGFNQIGWSCGLIGRHAAGRLGSNVYWMSGSNFFALVGSGAPQMIPCTVWDFVFQDLSATYKEKSWAWPNTPFNEMWFHFPRQSTGATECDASAVYNVAEGVWYFNDDPSINRSAGIDQSIVGMPIATTPGGIIYEHEVSPNADGQPINASFTTGFYQLSDGQDLMLCDWLLPDMIWQNFDSGNPSASIQMTINSYKYLSSTPRVQTFTVTQATAFVNPRLRGRFVSLTFASDDVGSWWRFGGTRLRLSKDGRL